jgi:hypothetical protein
LWYYNVVNSIQEVIQMTPIERNRALASEWFFAEGYREMNKLEQVAFLIDECGYTEAGAWELVFGCTE